MRACISLAFFAFAVELLLTEISHLKNGSAFDHTIQSLVGKIQRTKTHNNGHTAIPKILNFFPIKIVNRNRRKKTIQTIVSNAIACSSPSCTDIFCLWDVVSDVFGMNKMPSK